MQRGRGLEPCSGCAAGRPSPRSRSSRATCCSPRTPARGCTSATCPRPARWRWCAGPSRRGFDVTAEVTPHHLLLTDDLVRGLRPGVQGQPAAAHARGRRGGARRPRRRHDRRRRHRPRAARRWRQGLRVGRGGDRHARPARRRCRSCSTRWSTPGCWTGRRSPTGCRCAPPRSARSRGHGRPLEPGEPANLTLLDPAAGRTIEPDALYSRSRNTPFAGLKLPGAVLATFLRGTATVLDGKVVDR